MSCFGLDPESVTSRGEAGRGLSGSSSGLRAIILGSVGFGLVSLIVFGVWAFGGQWLYMNLGEAGFYAVCAVLFMGLSGLVLYKLITVPRSLGRFYALWACGFAAYALIWSVCWFMVRGKANEWLGSLLGTAAMGMIFASAFGAARDAFAVMLVLFVTNAAGYFLGGWLHGLARAPLSMFLWGGAYGFIWGAGIGYALYLCQRNLRETLLRAQTTQPGP